MRRGINIAVSLIVLVALIVFCFSIQCNVDLYLIIAGFVLVALNLGLSFVQEKKLR